MAYESMPFGLELPPSISPGTPMYQMPSSWQLPDQDMLQASAEPSVPASLHFEPQTHSAAASDEESPWSADQPAGPMSEAFGSVNYVVGPMLIDPGPAHAKPESVEETKDSTAALDGRSDQPQGIRR